MASVQITKSKLDNLANAIGTKNANLTLPATLDELVAGVNEIVTSDSLRFQAKVVAPGTAQQQITPDTGYAALSQVTVGAVPTEQRTFTANGTYTPNTGYFIDQVTVNVQGTTETVSYTANTTVIPTEYTQYALPDDGDTALLQVTVNPIPSNYRDISNVTATPSDVLAGKSFITSAGVSQVGILAVYNYYVGEGAPSTTLGNDGDLYFEV